MKFMGKKSILILEQMWKSHTESCAVFLFDIKNSQ